MGNYYEELHQLIFGIQPRSAVVTEHCFLNGVADCWKALNYKFQNLYPFLTL
jgi:hypothetical protein